jgi:hypothetical protein
MATITCRAYPGIRASSRGVSLDSRQALVGNGAFLKVPRLLVSALAEVEDALGARKFGQAGACNGTLDLDLTLATICQA